MRKIGEDIPNCNVAQLDVNIFKFQEDNITTNLNSISRISKHMIN